MERSSLRRTGVSMGEVATLMRAAPAHACARGTFAQRCAPAQEGRVGVGDLAAQDLVTNDHDAGTQRDARLDVGGRCGN